MDPPHPASGGMGSPSLQVFGDPGWLPAVLHALAGRPEGPLFCETAKGPSTCERAAWQLKWGALTLKRVPAPLFALLILSVAMGTASDCNHHCLYCELAPINVAFEK